MASKTRNDLILRVLTLLGANGVGQPPSEEDRAAVEVQIDTTLDQLIAKRITDFASRLEFDPEIFQPLALRLAAVVAPDLAISKVVGYENYSLDQLARLAESEIRYIRAEDNTNEPIRFQDF